MTRVLLCDLDDTLFDHSGATRDALAAVREHTPAFLTWTLDEFDRRHRVVLETLHLQVLAGRYTVEDARVERFRQLLGAAGVEERRMDVLDGLSWAYRHAYEAAWRMVPGAIPFMSLARQAGWRVAIVTNNVAREQRLKVERGGLTPFIDALVTSEEFGASKPDPSILLHAMRHVGGDRDGAVVFGDSLTTDIAGARAAGLSAVWFNRLGAPSPDPALREVRSLEPAGELWRVMADAATAPAR